MRYIINNQYAFCGYKGLPFALYNTESGDTFFFSKEEYSLLLDCDGQTEIEPETLNENDQKIFRSFFSGDLIRPCGEESLMPRREYHLYENYYRDNVQFSITGRCNYRCKHCFMSAPHAKYDEMCFDDCVKVIQKLADCGVRNVQLTGGEPLVHPDFKKIVQEISDRGLHIQMIYTNGLLLGQDIFDLLKANNQNPRIQISFDGLGYHDWMRGVKNAEKHAVDAIKRCGENGFECEVATVLFRDNVDSLRETVKFLDGLGVSIIRVTNVYDQGEWLPYVKEHGISRTELFDKYLEYIPKYFEDDLNISISLEGFFNFKTDTKKAYSTFENTCTRDTEDRYYLCKSIKKSFYITSGGLVLPCASMMSTEVEEGALNILDTDLREIINNSDLYEIGNKKAKDLLANNKKCGECEYRYVCLGGCRARSLVNHNGLFGIDEGTCAYFLGGYKEKKDKLLEDLGYGKQGSVLV